MSSTFKFKDLLIKNKKSYKYSNDLKLNNLFQQMNTTTAASALKQMKQKSRGRGEETVVLTSYAINSNQDDEDADSADNSDDGEIYFYKDNLFKFKFRLSGKSNNHLIEIFKNLNFLLKTSGFIYRRKRLQNGLIKYI